MTGGAPRTGTQPRADTFAKLSEHGADIWVASASLPGLRSARAHLIPLSFAWIEEKIVLTADRAALTTRNIVEHRTARLALDSTRDVVMIDARLEDVLDTHHAPQADRTLSKPMQVYVGA
jgi:hypothetical protein